MLFLILIDCFIINYLYYIFDNLKFNFIKQCLYGPKVSFCFVKTSIKLFTINQLFSQDC